MKLVFIPYARLMVLSLGMLCVFGVTSARLVYLHILNHEALSDVARKSRYRFERLPAARGLVLDCKGRCLASTRSVITLGVDPQLYRAQDQSAWPALAQLAKVTPEAIQQAFGTLSRCTQDGETVWIRWKKLAEGLDENTYERILKLGIKGVYGVRQFERYYPGGPLACHVLGFVNKGGEPTGGIEQYLDFYLRGQDGWLESECDGKRREMLQFRSRHVDPKPGCTVHLTLDSTVQSIIEQALAQLAQEYRPQWACILVSQAQTGAILGLANWPHFDLNAFWQYPLDTHRNRAISDIYEPGSTFKMVTASAVLQEGCVDLQETFDCALPSVLYKGKPLPLPKNHRSMGQLTAAEAITQSSNRGIVQMALRLGEHKLYDYARAFGYGQLSGYGPAGEVRGILRPPSQWDGLTISRLPIGHALGATPLQVHLSIGVIASAGHLLKPQLISHISDAEDHTLVRYHPVQRRLVLQPGTVQHMRTLMAGVLQHTRVNGVTLAAKTGTSQKIIQGKYSRTQHVSSASGFFPVEDPQIVITVVIDAAQYKGTAYGSLVAAPVLKNVAGQLISYLRIKPSASITSTQQP